MKEIYKDYLFEKHILVSDGETEEKHVFETLFAMAHFFGVKITKGRELVHCGMVKELSKRFGENVPKPFYRGFPQSVRNLSTEELLFDQLAHYFNAYGLGNFEEPGQSMFEKDFERVAFQEETEVQEFVIQTEEEAEETENEKTLTSEPVKKDPRKGFMKLLKEGSVPLIMGEKKVSDLPINIVYGKKDTTKQSAWNFMNRKDVEKELDEFEKTASTDSFASELPAVLYATKYFHFLTDTTKKDGIKYEIEYLIAGKDSEKENLGMIFWRMIALRFVMNAACVYQDPAKEKEAALLAASILGVTGFPPAVVVAKNLLLLALAYGESVIDVRNLADGKKIPAVKTSSDWQLSFAGLATLNCKRKPVKQGMSYEDYLLLLLISQKDKRQKYFRMMDLMEQNIRRKVSDFKLDQCISSYKITQNLKLKKLGFGGMILPFATYTDLKMYRYVTY